MAQKFKVGRDIPDLDHFTVLYRDIKRFAEFSDDYIALSPDQSLVLGVMLCCRLARCLYGVLKWIMEDHANMPNIRPFEI